MAQQRINTPLIIAGVVAAVGVGFILLRRPAEVAPAQGLRAVGGPTIT